MLHKIKTMHKLIGTNQQKKTIYCNDIAYDRFYTSIGYIEKPRSIGYYLDYCFVMFLKKNKKIDDYKLNIEPSFFSNYKITKKINLEIYENLKKYAEENNLLISILIYDALLSFANEVRKL